MIQFFATGPLLASLSLLACIGFATYALQLANSLFGGMRGAIDSSDAGLMQQNKPQQLLVLMQLLVMVAVAPSTQPVKAAPAIPIGLGCELNT